MSRYPTRTWLALRDLDGPDMHALARLTDGIADWLDRYRDLVPDAEVMLRVERVAGGQVCQLGADRFWGGRAVEGQMVVARKRPATEADIEVVLRLAAECDDTVDRSDDAPRGVRTGKAQRKCPAGDAGATATRRRACPRLPHRSLDPSVLQGGPKADPWCLPGRSLPQRFKEPRDPNEQ
ncbi:MAG: hypothetical protein MUF54_24540 [Polyangiaceae bacterium]|jgi:hypothetical protein|nr:hypothetical protein [Polyangiaceae bacterium]